VSPEDVIVWFRFPATKRNTEIPFVVVASRYIQYAGLCDIAKDNEDGGAFSLIFAVEKAPTRSRLPTLYESNGQYKLQK
jgi:hypothetical protein